MRRLQFKNLYYYFKPDTALALAEVGQQQHNFERGDGATTKSE